VDVTKMYSMHYENLKKLIKVVFPRRGREYFVVVAGVGLQLILTERGPHFLLAHLLWHSVKTPHTHTHTHTHTPHTHTHTYTTHTPHTPHTPHTHTHTHTHHTHTPHTHTHHTHTHTPHTHTHTHHTHTHTHPEVKYTLLTDTLGPLFPHRAPSPTFCLSLQGPTSASGL